MPVWDPTRYLQFADDRARPFLDLIAQVHTQPHTIADLGCGPGHLTRHLREGWHQAHILGIDSSAQMINTAISSNSDPLANYDVADIATWTPPAPVDLIVSNAMFQWVPEQFAILERLLSHVTVDGTFAIQVPNNAAATTHTAMAELANTEPYAKHLVGVRHLQATEPLDYLTFFAGHGFAVNAWETTYLHVLTGTDPVFDWVSGTGARPYLQALPDDLAEQFTADLKGRLREAYPAETFGTVLPFRRTFAVATRQ